MTETDFGNVVDGINQQSQPRSRERPSLLELLEAVEAELMKHDRDYHYTTSPSVMANLRNEITKQKGVIS